MGQVVREKRAAQHGLQPAGLSWFDFEAGFGIVGDSGQSRVLQTRLAAEPNRCPECKANISNSDWQCAVYESE
jgi:hypothetical protein